MSGITKLWAGRVFGTNTGNLFVEMSGEDKNLSGKLRFSDGRWGVVVYAIKGAFDGTRVEFNGEVEQAPEGVSTAAGQTLLDLFLGRSLAMEPSSV
jgi:hypothetical protein